jgi:hypothetical protein
MALGFFGGLIILGLGMLALPFLNRSDGINGLPDWVPDNGERQEMEWSLHSKSKNEFKYHIRKIDPIDEQTILEKGQEKLLSSDFLHLASANICFRSERFLESGHEFSSVVDVRFRRIGKIGQIKFEIERHSGEQIKYFVELQEGEITKVQVDSARGTDSLSESSDYLHLVRSSPVGIGDLLLADIFGLYSMKRTGAVKTLGKLEFPGSRGMFVFDGAFFANSDFPEEEESADSNSFEGRGVSTLIYVDQQDFIVRRLLIFDAEERLVRLYEDFHFVESDMLRSLRVTSLVTKSHTVFWIDRF